MMVQMMSENPLGYFRLIAIMIISICLHELAHGIVAVMQGDNTPTKSGHMTFNPIVHMGVESIFLLCLFGIGWGAMPVNTSKFRSRQWGDFLVSAAGPLLNLSLGIICTIVLKFSEYYPFLSKEFFYLAAIVNFNLFFFNCLPIPPLDGFHMFSKFFPGLRELKNTSFGTLAIVIIMIFGIGGTLSAISSLIISSSLNLF